LAIGFGALIILTRAPLIVRPPEALELYRGLWATNARARAMGVLYLALGLACILGAAETSGITRQLLYVFAVVLLAVTAWMLAAPTQFRAVADRVVLFMEESVDAAAIRVLALLGVCIGGVLIWLGIRAL
jgi:hypothetical protein